LSEAKDLLSRRMKSKQSFAFRMTTFNSSAHFSLPLFLNKLSIPGYALAEVEKCVLVSFRLMGEDAGKASVAKSRSKAKSRSLARIAEAAGISVASAKLRMLKKLRCTLKFEKLAWASGATLVAGVDEVGRGSLFGPVVAAAVILDPERRIRGLRDSKLVPVERREELAMLVRERAIAWAIASVDSARIDQINIYQASRLAMLRAVQQLMPMASHLLVDAVRIDCELPQRAIIHGDALSVSIAAASIIAKVERDRMVAAWDPVFPIYGLASNKGYSTPRHKVALREHGPSPLHRLSFAPVWNAPIPQEVFTFMEEEGVEELLADEEAVAS
jgi:ribonuclease HII